MPNLKDEISREPPFGYPQRTYSDGKPILYAFECALLELETENGFTYTAVNLNSGKSEKLSRRKSPLSPREVEKITERIQRSSVAGAGRYQIDRPVGQRISVDKALEILRYIFTTVLPRYGYKIRQEQIDLAEYILDTIAKRGTALAEAEVGTGKTLAYLIPAIISKLGRLNDEKNLSLYPGMQYADMSKMPLVIATSSIALQKAIITEYIPELSRILLESGVIKTELTAVLRKGREHYVCRRNLRNELAFQNDPAIKRTLGKLLMPKSEIDLAEISELPQRVKKRISVPGRCFDTCKHREGCPYLDFQEEARSFDKDIQVCNHNYLLADTIHRANGKRELIPNYQTLIVDEAHKFISAAQSMYGLELSSLTANEILEAVDKLDFRRGGYQKLARYSAKKMFDESAKLFRGLYEKVSDDGATERLPAVVDMDATRCLLNICDISERLSLILRDELLYAKAEHLLLWVGNKYGVDTDGIRLKKLLPATFEDGITREEQAQLVSNQVNALYNAICEIPAIKQRVELERSQCQERRYSYNPERQAIANEYSKIQSNIWNEARRLLGGGAYGDYSVRIVRLIWKAEQLREQTNPLKEAAELVYWLEHNDDEMKLCAIPKGIDKMLYTSLWSKAVPTILTSGTLSASSDFSHTKRTLGLERLKSRVTETSKPSPFNHRENALLYISKNVPFPDKHSKTYIAALTDEIERLIRAAHGHTAVLFTSYNVMGLVYSNLEKRGLSFPMFKLERSTSNAIERFKKSGNGVLFASGALWEGIDIPGDALSMLIIVKLPFQVPDPISEYEQTLYPSFRAYRDLVITPEMLIKLKQGCGRLLRIETDTGVIALLDCRVGLYGAYRGCVLNGLPGYRLTDEIADIAPFLLEMKEPEYWLLPQGLNL